VQAGDPRADPAVIDLIELAGLWLAADDREALRRTLERLIEQLRDRFPDATEFRDRFERLLRSVNEGEEVGELRRSYRRATLG
jgi:hypothetical protein